MSAYRDDWRERAARLQAENATLLAQNGRLRSGRRLALAPAVSWALGVIAWWLIAALTGDWVLVIVVAATTSASIAFSWFDGHEAGRQAAARAQLRPRPWRPPSQRGPKPQTTAQGRETDA